MNKVVVGILGFLSVCVAHARDTDGSSNDYAHHGRESYQGPPGWNPSVDGNWNEKQHAAYLARIDAEEKAKAARKAAKAKTKEAARQKRAARKAGK